MSAQLNKKAGGQGGKSSFQTRAKEIAESILDFVDNKSLHPYLDSVVFSGLAYCVTISERTILPLIQEHKSLPLMMQRVDKSRKTDSGFTIYKVC